MYLFIFRDRGRVKSPWRQLPPSSAHIRINVELFFNAASSRLQIASWSHSKVKGISLSLSVAFKDMEERSEVRDLEWIHLITNNSIAFEPGELLPTALTLTKFQVVLR